MSNRVCVILSFSCTPSLRSYFFINVASIQNVSGGGAQQLLALNRLHAFFLLF
uniref:Uncharacterized protein n=1 Tax=Arundo donax TaxID=35708 RepID=A0A0A9AA39_ARUDO